MRRLVVAGVIGALKFSLAACSSSQEDPPVLTTTTHAPAKSEQANVEANQQTAADAEAARLAAEQAEADRVAAEQAEADRVAAEQAEADRVAAEAAAQAERDAQAAAEQAAAHSAAEQAAAEAAEEQAEHEAAERAVHEERERILAEGFTDENGTTYSPETVRRGVEAGIYPGDPIPGYLRCGTVCGETPTSGELQAWNAGLVPVPPGYEGYLAPNATPYDSCEAAADRVEYGMDDDGVVSCNPD